MKIILLFSVLLVSLAYHAQVYELPATMKNAKYKDVLSYIQEQINAEKKWTKKKVSLSLFLSKWYTRNWEYDQANKIMKSIPRSKIRSNKFQGDYFLLKATLSKGDLKKAAYFYQLSIRQFEREHNLEAKLNASITYAEFRRGNGQYDLGLEILEQVEQALKENPSDYLMMKVANRRAAIFNEKTLIKESIESSRLSIQLAKKVNDIYYEAISYKELGACYKNMSYTMLDSSRLNYQLSEKRFREIGLIKEAIQAKESWISTYINKSDNKSVINWYKEIENEIKKKQLNYPLIDIYLKISMIYLSIEDYENAFKYRELYSQENVRFIYEKKESELKKVKGEFVALILQSENEKIKQDNKRKQIALKEEQTRSSRYIVVVIVLVVLLLTVIFLLSRNRKLTHHLTVQNKEKDMLIQEVHHRVKNNLQFVKSILLLQATKRGEGEQVLKDVSRRIDAMSLVHELLYSNNVSNHISVKNYLDKLIRYSEKLFVNKKPVRINLNIEDIELPIEQTVAIGIICSELLTNSVKYAFDAVEHPEFTIELLQKKDNTFIMNVHDNNLTSTNDQEYTGLGMQLIDIFSRQLKGEYSINKKNGYYYHIKFKVKDTSN